MCVCVGACILLYGDDIVAGKTGSGGKARGHRLLRSRLKRVDPLSWFRYAMVIVSYIEFAGGKKIYTHARNIKRKSSSVS